LASSKKAIFKIGITGGIGSGKTTAATAFASYGVPVLFADELAKEISVRDPALRKTIVSLFGPDAYAPDGSLHRSFLASRIFAQPLLKKKLEAAVHPRVEEELNRQCVALQHAGSRMVVIEAALLYEAKLSKKMDTVIVVDADEEVKIRRVMQREGWTEQEVRSRMNAQLSPDAKRAKADYVLFNNGTQEDLARNVQFLYSLFTHLVREE
jgi:dephospho-CoA kinase